MDVVQAVQTTYALVTIHLSLSRSSQPASGHLRRRSLAGISSAQSHSLPRQLSLSHLYHLCVISHRCRSRYILRIFLLAMPRPLRQHASTCLFSPLSTSGAISFYSWPHYVQYLSIALSFDCVILYIVSPMDAAYP